MTFLSSRVPMSKFGAKVELRCNDGTGWIRIRIRMDPELLPGSGSGSGTRKIQSWIRIRNKSFRIQNTEFMS